MIRDDMGCLCKPKSRKLVEHSSFVRNTTGQDNIEGRDTVGGNYEELIT
jgi:hypothetical protein